MNARHLLFSALLVSCSNRPDVTPPLAPADAGLDVAETYEDAGPEPVEPIPTDGGCALPNGGSGICKGVFDCPPEDACWSWSCQQISTGDMKCIAYAKDGGP